MDTEFKREERYIVLKRKGLYPEQESAIHDLLDDMGVLTVECVVVESDWPESETVWKMIRDRVEGRPNELDAANERIRELEKLGEAISRDCNNTALERNSLSDQLATEREVSDKLADALQAIADETYDTWTNGFIAQRKAITCLAEVAAIRAKETT